MKQAKFTNMRLTISSSPFYSSHTHVSSFKYFTLESSLIRSEASLEIRLRLSVTASTVMQEYGLGFLSVKLK